MASLMDLLNPQMMGLGGGFMPQQQGGVAGGPVPPGGPMAQQPPMELSSANVPQAAPQAAPQAPSWFDPNHPMTANLPINAMMGFGMGMMSGNDRASGWGGALQGMMAGRAADADARKQRLQQAALQSIYGGGPGGAAPGGVGGTAPGGRPSGGGNLAALAAAFPDKAASAAFDNAKLTEAYKNWQAAGRPGRFADFLHQPEFGVIGKDPYGGEVRGFINKADRTTSAAPSPGGDGGGMPMSMLREFRKDVQDLPSYKTVAAASPVYNSMLDAAGRDNRGADVNLIYGLAKIMDPGSVVRESEMTIAQAISTFPQHLRATVESQITASGRLSADVREQIMTEARSRALAYKQTFDQEIAPFRQTIARAKGNEAEIIPSFGPFNEFKAEKRTEKPPSEVVPKAAQKYSAEKQLQLAPNNSRATIDGVPSIKRNGKWEPVR